MIFSDGSVYDGDWVDGKGHGQASFTRGSDGHRYIGGWGENGSEGFGTYTLADGTVQTGIFENDIFKG